MAKKYDVYILNVIDDNEENCGILAYETEGEYKQAKKVIERFDEEWHNLTEDEIIAKYGYYNYWQTLYNKLEEQQLYSLNVKRGAVYIK